jgi:hypothetical protein
MAGIIHDFPPLGLGLVWPRGELELDLEIVRRLLWSEIDAIVSSLRYRGDQKQY